jgi:pSer/pThr/pTyr-binding forkhead associated (FHA) protein
MDTQQPVPSVEEHGAFVRIRGPKGERYDLAPGDLIGRAATAALCVDDARVSEAHAMVSLRGEVLKLLGLRGRFAVDGRICRELEFAEGQRIALAPGLVFTVTAVILPERVLALQADGMPTQVVPAVASLVEDPHLSLVGGLQPGALATMWVTGGRWRMAPSGSEPRDLHPGDVFEVGGRQIRAVTRALASAAQEATQVDAGLRPPLKLVSNYTTVQIHHREAAVLVVGGIGARLIAELVSFDGPVPWEVLASEIWGGASVRRDRLRRKLDAALGRLRGKLVAAGLPRDLVRMDGSGCIELVLQAGDEVEDRA